MKLRYIHTRTREVIPATGSRPFVVQPDQTVEVDANTGKSLAAQTDLWEPVKEPTKPAKSKP